MPNKDRATGEWSPVVKPETQLWEARALEMYKEGNSITNIAKLLKVSDARVREYLKTLKK